ncbi:MAG: hypothetical protein ABTR27_04125, partial [Candidatus Competibacter phosphatis]
LWDVMSPFMGCNVPVYGMKPLNIPLTGTFGRLATRIDAKIFIINTLFSWRIDPRAGGPRIDALEMSPFMG